MTTHKPLSFLGRSVSRVILAILVVSISVFAEAGSIAGSDAVALRETPNLPFGDINVVILTDVHSWLGGHRRHEPRFDADLGDVLSFWERLKEACDMEDKDLFLVNNGDFVDGTGLSETVDNENNPEYLIPLLEKMPYDAVNVGNHELYSKDNIEYMTRPGGYVDWWGDRYLSSNINKVDVVVDETTVVPEASKDATKIHGKPLGHRYKILEGKNSKLLVFGFLYNMRDHGAGVEIEKVESTVQQDWFVEALSSEDYDAILVLAHMDLVDPLVQVLLSAVRDVVGDDMSVVFATGHTHYRGVKELEDHTLTFEAGRYLDTVGFVSFPKKDHFTGSNGSDDEGTPPSSIFGHKFLDTNKKVLFEDVLGFQNADDGITKDGRDFSDFIEETRQKLGLEKVIGCAPHSYHVNRHIDAKDSLWGLYRDEVIPNVFDNGEDDDLPSAMLLPSGNWRYDLYKNDNEPMVVDDIYAIAPFNDTLVHLGIFDAEVILKGNHTLNMHQHGSLPSYILVGDLAARSRSLGATTGANGRYHLYTHEFSAATLKHAFQKLAPTETVEIRKTEFTSSLLWLAFVEKYWPCSGSNSASPPGDDPSSLPQPPPKRTYVRCSTSVSTKSTNYTYPYYVFDEDMNRTVVFLLLCAAVLIMLEICLRNCCDSVAEAVNNLVEPRLEREDTGEDVVDTTEYHPLHNSDVY